MLFINAQLGRILLLIAVAWTVLCLLYGNKASSAPAHSDNVGDVHVEYDKSEHDWQTDESFFASKPEDYYAGNERCIFVPEKKIREFESVELDIPPAPVMRPPQILPDPGPSLEGSHKLPRFNDMWPATKAAPAPVVVPKKPAEQ